MKKIIKVHKVRIETATYLFAVDYRSVTRFWSGPMLLGFKRHRVASPGAMLDNYAKLLLRFVDPQFLGAITIICNGNAFW